MCDTKRVWIIDKRTNYVIERNGQLFSFQLIMTERNGYTDVKEAKKQMYSARRALHTDKLTLAVY